MGWQDEAIPVDTGQATPTWQKQAVPEQDTSEEKPEGDFQRYLKKSEGVGPKTSAAGAFTRSAVKSAPGTAAAIAAFPPGAELGGLVGTAITPGIGTTIGALGGGLLFSGLAAWGGTAATNKLLDLIPEDIKKRVGMDKATLEADAKQHPLASFAGELAPMVATGRVGSVPKAARLAGAALGGGVETGREVASGEGLSPAKIAMSAGAGALAQGKGKLGSKARVEPPPVKGSVVDSREFGEHLKDAHHQEMQRIEAEKAQTLKKITENKELAKAYQPVREELTHSDVPGTKLSEPAQKIKQQVVEPLAKEVDALRQRIKGYGVGVGEDLDNYLPRIQVNANKRSIFEDVGGMIPSNQSHGFGTKAGSLMDRSAVALEVVNPRQGELLGKDAGGLGQRMIAVRDPKTGQIEIWNGGKVTGKSKVTPSEWASGEFKVNGLNVKRGQATIREIESNTPIRYHHDPVASLIDTKYRLEKVATNLAFLDTLRGAPESKSVMAAGKAAEVAPKDWKEVDGLPLSFKGTKFEPHVAESLEDIIGKHGDNFLDHVGNVSRVITGSMFWNPMPHIWNVASHFAVEKGLVGGTVGMVKGTAKTLVDPSSNLTLRAIKAVTTQNEDYIRFLKSGAGMMSPGPFNKDFSQQVMTALGSKPEMGAVAKAWGYANPKEMIKGVYSASRKSLWGVNDMMLMQAYLAKEQSGMTAEAAIKDVERHIPNYKMPSRVMFDNKLGRGISKALRDPSAFAFGRYEYNRMASYGHMVTDLLGKDKSIGDRAHALDQMAMLYFTTAVMYPFVADPIAQAVTGNDNASAQRFGANAVPFWIDQYMHADDKEFNRTYGSKNLDDVIQSTFLPAPATKGLFEMVTNTDSFTKKPLVEGAGDVPGMLMDKTLPPLKELKDIASGKKSLGSAAMKDFAGINNPTEKQLRSRDAYLVKERSRELRKEKKRRTE